MEKFAYDQFLRFHDYFENQALKRRSPYDDSPSKNEISKYRMEAEEILDQTTVNAEFDSSNDPEIIMLKSTILAKYITVDHILEKNHGINEAQLKRVLYKSYFDDIEAQRGFKFKLRKLFGLNKH